MLRTLIDDLDGALRATRIGELLRPRTAGPQTRNDADSFSHWLPYRAWLEDRQVFVNRDALGFCLEVRPQSGANEEMSRVLTVGNVILLQETHWTFAVAAQWGGLFCAAQVAHSVARDGPRGGPQGGVAVVVPLPHRILEVNEVVPGCVLEVVIAVCGTHRRASFVSIYLPPDGRGQVLDALQGMGAPAAPEVYAGGDVNMQLHAPRDDGERDDGERLQAILARWGSCPIVDGRVTRRSRTSQASLDILAVPGWDAWSWSTRLLGTAASPTTPSARHGARLSFALLGRCARRRPCGVCPRGLD